METRTQGNSTIFVVGGPPLVFNYLEPWWHHQNWHGIRSMGKAVGVLTPTKFREEAQVFLSGSFVGQSECPELEIGVLQGDICSRYPASRSECLLFNDRSSIY